MNLRTQHPLIKEDAFNHKIILSRPLEFEVYIPYFRGIGISGNLNLRMRLLASRRAKRFMRLGCSELQGFFMGFRCFGSWVCL